MNPRAATNDLLPFQGSPFNHLGTSAWLNLDSYSIYICRQIIKTRLQRRGWDSNPRALADKRFSRPPRYDHFDISPYFRRFSLSAQVIFYHLISELSTTNLNFFYFFILAFFQIAKMPLQSKDLPVW